MSDASRDARAVLGVGIDMASVEEVRGSIARFGDAYLSHLFTPREREECGTSPERLSARFAAKEAAIKALRIADRRPPWTSIEVRRRDEGSCELWLTGAARALCEAKGVTELLLSLTHATDVAGAVVVALGEAPSPSPVPDAAGA